ncbi:DNA recombination protein RmuC [Allosphingosinicella flava]|uniref:DNA recombination protein RmuC homolog n=1 Tax=Allosphingosinicella flava TaxID=2771430 RepID=A0A7T2GKQ3_9SPHN|nr:DNA recombination protein RmuC [Sphingosinicella flava]QPQ55639.1 DNA recombination protein RmuC [Sphingosinicella flava]
MDPFLLVAAACAVVAALGLGWAIGRREAAAYRKERDERLEDFRRAITDLAAAEERAKAVPMLQEELAHVREEGRRAQTELARITAGQIERDRAYEARLAELKDARDAMSAQFSEVGNKLLGEAQKQFLERADARFHQAGEKSEEKLKALLQPVEATLKRYEEGLTRVEKERVDHYAGLREAVELVRQGQSQVRDETARLVNALRSSPKARGRWGEQSLRNVLEQAGLSPYADFQMEVSVDTEDGRLRPDVIVNLPGGRKIIIDAKCSLNAYLDASEEVDEAVRAGHLKAHAGSIRTHAMQLGGKAYWQQFGDAADYVVMYIPGEHFLTAALEQDDGLWEWAFERRVLLATPTNLVAIARTVASVWRQEKLAEEAAEIARLGKELHARLATMGAHVVKLGRNLGLANDAYNSFVGSLESQVLTQAKRFETLEVSGGAKEIEALPVIDTVPRALTKLSGEEAEAAE